MAASLIRAVTLYIIENILHKISADSFPGFDAAACFTKRCAKQHHSIGYRERMFSIKFIAWNGAFTNSVQQKPAGQKCGGISRPFKPFAFSYYNLTTLTDPAQPSRTLLLSF